MKQLVSRHCTRSTRKLLAALCLTLAPSLIPHAAAAQSGDAVVVLSVGAVDTVELIDLSAASPQRGVSLGSLRILPSSLGPQNVADLKILPDGGFLLAGVDGRGVVVTDPEGEEIRFVYDPERRYPEVDAASVAGYLTPGEPARSLFADTGSSVVQIRDHGSNQLAWAQNLSHSGVRARFVQAIVLPGNAVAVASNWPALGLSAIDVFPVDLSAPDVGVRRRYANASHPEAPERQTIVPELETVRDLMGLPGGDLLVTTPYTVFRMRPDGALAWSLSTDAFPVVLGGEFASARALESGLVAVATFSPGQWTRPAIDHRVHWYDPEAAEIVATSEALNRAPHRLELAGGHGGTGTLGFDVGLDDLGRGDAETLALDSPLVLNALAYERGDVLRARAVIGNPGPYPVGLAEALIRARPGACGEDTGPGVELALSPNVALGAGASVAVSGAVSVDSRFGLGDWCARVEVRDTAGASSSVGAAVGFAAVEEGPDRPSPVTMTDLDVRQGAPDAGQADGGFDAGAAGGPGDEAGCGGCAASGGQPGGGQPGGVALLALLGLAALGVRRLQGAKKGA